MRTATEYKIVVMGLIGVHSTMHLVLPTTCTTCIWQCVYGALVSVLFYNIVLLLLLCCCHYIHLSQVENKEPGVIIKAAMIAVTWFLSLERTSLKRDRFMVIDFLSS